MDQSDLIVSVYSP